MRNTWHRASTTQNRRQGQAGVWILASRREAPAATIAYCRRWCQSCGICVKRRNFLPLPLEALVHGRLDLPVRPRINNESIRGPADSLIYYRLTHRLIKRPGRPGSREGRGSPGSSPGSKPGVKSLPLTFVAGVRRNAVPVQMNCCRDP